ncbi:oligosaccharide biosynthesis protein Alg14 like-domain-containing protein [Lipomyces japonicus]|uniref:oligosaccharide biosynthesis protein Alg14 like-domain-containing protein n=1 Tax=Lipomyces japonicus TaxID=56871 RepID=UPI0034CF383D
MPEFSYEQLGFVLLLISIALSLLAFLALSIYRTFSAWPPLHGDGAQALFVLGSGGHTTELLTIVRDLDFKQYPVRTWVSFSGDTLSRVRALQLEQDNEACGGKVTTVELPRARNVGQSYVTSVLTTFFCGIRSLQLVWNVRPDVVVCNGPGSCVLVCLACLLLRGLHIKMIRIVYIESLARVSSLSLTGKILIHLVDRFIVQWPQLAKKYVHAEYHGLLV